MTRFKLTLEYDGGPFIGWQRQENGHSVQAALEDAVTDFCSESALVEGAGRTDAGVHALGQIAHVDIEKETDAGTVRDALNFHLRSVPISVLAAEAVDENFHARFSARKRTYLYRILDRRPAPAIDKGRVWWVPFSLNVDVMHEAAQGLLGRHDFSSFRAAQCQAGSPVKTLDMLDVSRAGEEVHINAQARSFLHHQVRNFAGTLKLVGEGKWKPGEVAAVLAAGDRTRAGPTAPPVGLYLVSVTY